MPIASISLFLTDRKATEFLPLRFLVIFELPVARTYNYWDFTLWHKTGVLHSYTGSLKKSINQYTTHPHICL